MTAENALSHWAITPTKMTLAAERENKVYRVTTATGEYALRQHRQGYRSNAQLASELNWMAALDDAGLDVPKPIPTQVGTYLVALNGVHFDMLSWLPGKQLGAHGTPFDLDDATGTFFALGQSTARLHLASDNWIPPTDFTRPAWDAKGLLGDTPLWGRFWENPTMAHGQRELLEQFRDQARAALTEGDHDFGLIHADLLRENVLIDGETLRLIDFDDGGHGFRLFELATTLFRLKGEPLESELTTALIEGYQSLRPINITHLPLFIALRACTYVGWIVTRMEIPNAENRNIEHISNATQAVAKWLEREPIYV
jgi:Ser/Thr protein kinase RdoA (MazF antagonist)